MLLSDSKSRECIITLTLCSLVWCRSVTVKAAHVFQLLYMCCSNCILEQHQSTELGYYACTAPTGSHKWTLSKELLAKGLCGGIRLTLAVV